MIGDSSYDFGVNDHFATSNKIGYEIRYIHTPVEDRVARLLEKRDATMLKFNHKGVLIRFFMISMTYFIDNRIGTTDETSAFLLMN